MKPLAFPLAAVFLTACATTEVAPDSPPAERGDLGDEAGDASLACAPTTPPSGDARAAFAEAHGGGVAWGYESKDSDAVLVIEAHAGAGGPMSAGRHTIGPDDVSYASCGLCVILETGCKERRGRRQCAKAFMPVEGGSVSLSRIELEEGGVVAGALDDVVLREVQIGVDGKTQPVPDGETLCISAHTFAASMTAASGGEECGGHGHPHGDHCHCDEGYVPDPADDKRCIPE
ncbi:MAG: hypothetical protein KF894_16800 [Labilithrix sp.]|nr:hypothetical protein [Labilithrix sp.]